MESVDLDLKMVLGTTSMTFSDIANLEVGDAISLNQKISDPLKMFIENQFFGLVKPGKKDNALAVEILELTEGETDNE